MDDAEILAACEFAKTWLPPMEEKDKKTVSDALTNANTKLATPFLRQYILLLRPYLDVIGLNPANFSPREADCAASGIVFFYGCLTYIAHFPGWGKHIRDVFLYNLLYILVDHYIDDVRMNPEFKQQAIFQMFVLINDPTKHATLPLIDPVLKTIAETYLELITRCPRTKASIQRLFQVEIEGLAVQKDPNRSREEYHNIACKKGGYTMEILQDIVGNTDPELRLAAYHIGTIMQLIDDSIDVLNDRKNGIHTIATYDLQRKNLDELWLDIMTRVKGINPHFRIFTLLYVVFLVYLPDRLSSISSCSYSSALRSLTNPLNLFQQDGTSLLANAVMNEIVAMEILE